MVSSWESVWVETKDEPEQNLQATEVDRYKYERLGVHLCHKFDA